METKTNKKRKWLIAVAVILAILLLLVSAGALYYVTKLNMLNYDDGSREIDTSTVYPVDNDELDLPDLPDGPNEIDPADGEIYKDENVMNILLLGTDERSNTFSDNARADAIMVLSLNTKEHTMKLVSIERGIGVPVPGRNDDWITHTFRYGGAALTMQTVRECFKLDVEHYIRVNFNVFQDGIDTIGGVDINLTQAEANELDQYAQNTNSGLQRVQPGWNHLNGTTALAYARLRSIDSDWQRIERQRTVVQAAINQVKGLDLVTLDKLLNQILPMVQTNLTKGEITSLVLEMPGFIANGAQMEQMTIPTDDTCWNTVGVDGRKLIGVDFDANAKILREFFYGVTDEE